MDKQSFRRIFNSKFETSADAEGFMNISAALKSTRQTKGGRSGAQSGPKDQIKGKLGWKELGGEYLHFSLYKENKDTMEVVSFIAKSLNVRPKSFSFAGTKDRRGVTVQRISVWRQYAERLASLNRTLRGSKIGGFKYEPTSLELGDLKGNEFLITLRDCRFEGDDNLSIADRVELANDVLNTSVADLRKNGFINYFGLQRFGTFSTGTDEVGKKILQEDYEGAVWAILSYGEDALTAALSTETTGDEPLISRDDKARAHAIHLFKMTGKSQPAMDKMPRKFSAESTIIRHLGPRSKDFIGALLTINRNLRLMYVHAYQSLVWNKAASERWAKYGAQVVKGDLVIVESPSKQKANAQTKDEVDENGEVVVLPAAEDTAASLDDMFERARPLTEEEAKSGKYTIFDIVLPTPGYDIEYPDNEIGDFYKTFMASDAGGHLDPANMRRKVKDFSLSGSYRKILAQVGDDLSYEVKAYTNDNEQMVKTDLDHLYKPKQSNQPTPQSVTRAEDGKHTGLKVTQLVGEESGPESTSTAEHARTASGISLSSDSTGGGVPLPVEAVESTHGTKRAAEEPAKDESSKAELLAQEAENGEKYNPAPEKVAVIVKFQLGSSQYATMALRELMKQGGVKTFKPDFSSGR
jgi:tRNA pseudouridine13 synthase